MKVWKEVVSPGVYWYETADHQKKKLTVTAEAVKHLHDTGKAMLAAGLSIPVPKEHQDVGPLTAAQLAAKTLENNAGWVRDYRIAGGVLEAEAEITDAAIRKQITDGTVASTSPKIEPKFMDGNGKEWTSAITHLALTLRPRITAQKPFTAPTPEGWQNAAHMSLLTAGVTLTPSQGRHLRYGPGGWQLRDRVLFAMEEEDTAPDPMAKPDADADPDADPDADDGGDAGGYNFTELLKMLEDSGIHLPADTNEKNGWQHLWVALHAITGPQKAADEAANMEKGGGDMGATTQQQPPMFMSLGYIEKAGDPVKTAMARTMLTAAKARRQARIHAVCARNNDKNLEKDLLVDEAKAGAALSIKGDGSGIHDPMDQTLTMLERVVQDTRGTLLNRTLPGVQIAGAELAVHPADSGTGIDQEHAKTLADSLARAAGVQPEQRRSA